MHLPSSVAPSAAPNPPLSHPLGVSVGELELELFDLLLLDLDDLSVVQLLSGLDVLDFHSVSSTFVLCFEAWTVDLQ